MLPSPLLFLLLFFITFDVIARQGGEGFADSETALNRVALEPQAPLDIANLGATSEPMTESLWGWSQGAIVLVKTGGPVVQLLLLMSLLAATMVLVKLLQFWRIGLWQGAFARQALHFWQKKERNLALKTAMASPNPAAQAIARVIRGKERQLPESLIREEVLRYGCHVLFQLRRGLRPLEVIGSLAPLLGLLGTVLGMISAFQQLEAAGNKVNPAILSGGIWEALLTTAVGLCVAIPVVVLLNFLERQIDHLAHSMDDLVTQLFTEDLSVSTTVMQDKPCNLAVEQSKVSAIHAKTR